ncbi:twin-arginine translocase TatA/TatE family subunit [Georgenia sp. M64]|uniref:twin-arginine translocase TatA/TatE family subunit n=1 Tax=Georgenia sp. M64 TaxID=3120520 RepID=UPI0030E423FB
MGINGGEWVVLIVLAFLLIGPERLPEVAQQLGRLTRELKHLATGAKEKVREELGPEMDDLAVFDPRQYDPRRIVREALMEDEPSAAVRPARPPAARRRPAPRTAPAPVGPATAGALAGAAGGAAAAAAGAGPGAAVVAGAGAGVVPPAGNRPQPADGPGGGSGVTGAATGDEDGTGVAHVDAVVGEGADPAAYVVPFDDEAT